MRDTTLRAAVAALLAAAAPLPAQVASPSAAALGMGDNHTAAARGYAAVAWNPAALALSGNPRSSGAFAALRGIGGFGPVTLGDLAEYENRVVPEGVKEAWLAAVRRDGAQSGTAGGDLALLAAQYGRFGLQFSSSVRATSDVSPGVAELLLFGNADEQGNPREIPLGGSTVAMHAYSTAAVSYAVPIPVRRPGARLAVGATATYTLGHALVAGARSEGAATADPVAVDFRFPVVHSDFGSEFPLVSGSGVGVDLGMGYEAGAWSFGAVLQNAVSTFSWDRDRLRWREGSVAFDAERRESDFTARPLSSAPEAARLLAEEATFRRSLTLGAAARVSPRLAVAADARAAAAGGIGGAPSTHLGAGLEYAPLPWLPLRLGAAYVDGGGGDAGMLLGAGIGVRAGAFDVAASAGRRGGDTLLMLNLLSVSR
jgi:hypothetical protein